MVLSVFTSEAEADSWEARSRSTVPLDRVTLSNVTPRSVSVWPEATVSVPSWSVALSIMLSVFTIEKVSLRSSVPPDRVILPSVTSSRVSV